MNESIKKFDYLRPQLKNEAMTAIMQRYCLEPDCDEEEWIRLTADPPFKGKIAERIFVLLSPFAVKAFNEHCSNEIDQDELASISYTKLYEGIIKFNPDLNNGERANVKTYANKHMLDEIKSFITKNTDSYSCLSITSYTRFMLKKVKKSIDDLTRELNRCPTIEEISKNTGYSSKNIKALLDKKFDGSLRLDNEYDGNSAGDGDDSCSFHELVEDQSVKNPFANEDPGALSEEKKVAILKYLMEAAQKAKIAPGSISKAIDIFCKSTGCFSEKKVKFDDIAQEYDISSKTCKNYVKKIRNNISEEEIRKIFLNFL